VEATGVVEMSLTRASHLQHRAAAQQQQHYSYRGHQRFWAGSSHASRGDSCSRLAVVL
jgi:hypothetical protein